MRIYVFIGAELNEKTRRPPGLNFRQKWLFGTGYDKIHTYHGFIM